MALVKQQTSKFEQEPTSAEDAVQAVVDARNEAVQASAAVNTKPDATVETTVALATASASSKVATMNDLAQRAKEFQKEVAAMKGAVDFEYGTRTVFKAGNGTIAETGTENGVDLGKWAKVRLMAWDDRIQISPGESGDSSKSFVAYSKDAKVIDSVIGEELQEWVGRSCDDYMNYLRNDEGFKGAKSSRYIDLACALLASESGDGPIGKVIQVTLAQTSIPAFNRYQTELADNARCTAMGLPGFELPQDPFTFYLVREMAANGPSIKWTKIKVVATLPTKI